MALLALISGIALTFEFFFVLGPLFMSTVNEDDPQVFGLHALALGLLSAIAKPLSSISPVTLGLLVILLALFDVGYLLWRQVAKRVLEAGDN